MRIKFPFRLLVLFRTNCASSLLVFQVILCLHFSSLPLLSAQVKMFSTRFFSQTHLPFYVCPLNRRDYVSCSYKTNYGKCAIWCYFMSSRVNNDHCRVYSMRHIIYIVPIPALKSYLIGVRFWLSNKMPIQLIVWRVKVVHRRSYDRMVLEFEFIACNCEYIMECCVHYT